MLHSFRGVQLLLHLRQSSRSLRTNVAEQLPFLRLTACFLLAHSQLRKEELATSLISHFIYFSECLFVDFKHF